MNPLLGWLLAALAVAAGWQSFGWQGLLLGLTLVAFWLVLQFNRAVRVMKNAAASPIGHVDSAVMLNARLRPGMQMLQVVTLTRSLGQRVGPAGTSDPETFVWCDAGGAQVQVSFVRGRCQSWDLQRLPVAGAAAGAE
jgi:uncharacterized protein (DUF58 family)